MSILASHSIQNGTRHATTSKQQGVQFPGDFLSQYLPGGISRNVLLCSTLLLKKSLVPQDNLGSKSATCSTTKTI